jgi:hypothetical protein
MCDVLGLVCATTPWWRLLIQYVHDTALHAVTPMKQQLFKPHTPLQRALRAMAAVTVGGLGSSSESAAQKELYDVKSVDACVRADTDARADVPTPRLVYYGLCSIDAGISQPRS